jgi:hypothetical protein
MKTDNNEFMGGDRIDSQLELFRLAEPAKPVNAEFQQFLESLRQETRDILAIANEGNNYPDLKSIPNNELAIAVDKYHRANNIVHIEVHRVHNPKPSKPYSPWTPERKHRDRIRKMRERLSKKFAIPEMLINAILDDCLKNVQYFGLCQIDGDRCDCYYEPASVIAARAKELAMREAGL